MPKINLLREVTVKFRRFGELSVRNYTEEMVRLKCKFVTFPFAIHNHNSVEIADELEQFTDCYLVRFVDLQDARNAKKFLDATNFYGGLLHISYAPELESTAETRAKMFQRSQDVATRVRVHNIIVAVV